MLDRAGGAGTAADGTPLAPVTIAMGDASSWSWRTADRDRYGSVKASWTELGNAALNKVIVGDGQPRRVMRHVFATEAETDRTARAALEDAARGTETAKLMLAPFLPGAFAGTRVRFAELRPNGPATGPSIAPCVC